MCGKIASLERIFKKRARPAFENGALTPVS